ncbi:hypothetical protein KC360_g5401 [Hortaea werneckii]|nr:hypothetical protein KC325_g6539 [Hortaea werneckii]KAI6992314.1 hypothetical protein KC359_g5762 [Hortaea werneckii]KAI7144807.1 hypothetical protein KC344_g5054 [Hortaea werneckii]KAI7172595.1 hypothetical protein KC360_g5401 [Hortaea werneckii]
MPANGAFRQVRFAVPASPTVLSPTFMPGSMSPTMTRSGSRSPPPAENVSQLRGDLPLVHSPGWTLAMREVLADEPTARPSAAGGSGQRRRERPSDQYQWDADDLASLRIERMERELRYEIAEAADRWAANQAAFEADRIAGYDWLVETEHPTTIGEMLNGRVWHDSLTGGDLDDMDSDEDYDSDTHSNLAFGTDLGYPTSSTAAVDMEGPSETRRLSLEVPVGLNEAEIGSDSTGSDGDYMSDSSSISISDSMDSDWASTASSATTPGSDLDDISDTDDDLQTYDDLTDTIDDILALLVPANSYAREAFLTLALILVSEVLAEFDDVQVDYLATYLQNFRDNSQGQNPIGFFTELCQAMGLLG